MVNIVRKKQDQGNKHVFLIIEMIENNHYKITRADLFLDNREKVSKGYLLTSGQALIEICSKPLKDMEILVDQCVFKCWRITSDQSKQLISNLEKDRLELISYLNVGNSPLYGDENHNCLTWCEKHLTKIGIDISHQKSWFDVIVAYPQFHLPEDPEPDISRNKSLSESEPDPEPDSKNKICLMM